MSNEKSIFSITKNTLNIKVNEKYASSFLELAGEYKKFKNQHTHKRTNRHTRFARHTESRINLIFNSDFFAFFILLVFCTVFARFWLLQDEMDLNSFLLIVSKASSDPR